MSAAARITDLHMCPMTSTDPQPIPHVGGPIIGPGASSVFIGKLPAALLGDNLVCVGPLDTIITASATVFICGKAAVRIGDKTSHGGSILLGCPTVFIGD